LQLVSLSKRAHGQTEEIIERTPQKGDVTPLQAMMKNLVVLEKADEMHLAVHRRANNGRPAARGPHRAELISQRRSTSVVIKGPFLGFR
jgi:hypothetical protein